MYVHTDAKQHQNPVSSSLREPIFPDIAPIHDNTAVICAKVAVPNPLINLLATVQTINNNNKKHSKKYTSNAHMHNMHINAIAI